MSTEHAAPDGALADDRTLASAAYLLPNAGREAILAQLEERSVRAVVEAVGVLAEPAPVFVTLRIDERLRGCIGSLRAMTANMVEETIDRAQAAAFEDPRFPRLTIAELACTSIEVSILRPLRPVASPDELDPSRYGIEVRDPSGRRAVLLPDIPGVETVEHQIEVTREKAGIPPGADVQIRKFTVVKVPDPLFVGAREA